MRALATARLCGSKSIAFRFSQRSLGFFYFALEVSLCQALRRQSPPPGKPHRYFFKLYALNAKLGLNPGATKADVERAMQGHILAQGELMGRYGR